MEHTQQHPVQHVDLTGWPGPAPQPAPVRHPGGPIEQLQALGRDIVAAGYAESARPETVEASAPASPTAVEGEPVTHVDLPSGGWAELTDPRKIRAKHRKRVLDQLNIERMQSGKGGIAFDMTDGLILMMVDKWEVPYLPGVARPLDNPACVDELMIPDYDAIADRLEEAREMLFPAPATVDGAKTPGSPTPPAGD